MGDTWHWPNGQKCAVSLTYDDGLPIHYDYVGPFLQSVGLRGTFYIPIKNDPRHHPERWRELARQGHELGNHTLFHPCTRTPDREAWLDECYDLSTYTPERFRLELEIANLVLYLIDGKHERTYGNTCCETTLRHGEKMIPMDGILSELFVAARGPYNDTVADVHADINLMQVGHYSGDGKSFSEIRQEIEGAASVGGWIVYMLHGVGPETHRLHIDRAEHEILLAWLGAHQAEIWTASFIEVATFVRQQWGF